ncbi:unnamed protein product, partial [marine sediment metagenome]
MSHGFAFGFLFMYVVYAGVMRNRPERRKERTMNHQKLLQQV